MTGSSEGERCNEGQGHSAFKQLLAMDSNMIRLTSKWGDPTILIQDP